jgi:hypothetical protein
VSEVLDQYESGPDATVRATEAALGRLDGARAAVLVEGVTDQVAVEHAAEARGQDLEADGVVVVPIGGAHAIGRVMAELAETDLVLSGLCDRREEPYFRRAFEGLPRHRYFVCDADLEDELLRAAGEELVMRTIIAERDAKRFATMRKQAAWADATFDAQVRRFLTAGAHRKHRYAAALVRALGPRRLPAPLIGALEHVRR